MENIPNVQLTPVKSSQIAGIGHDPLTKTLAVKFNGGGTYHYQGVSEEAFAEFKNAESIGKHFGAAIRGKYDSKRLPEEQKAEQE